MMDSFEQIRYRSEDTLVGANRSPVEPRQKTAEVKLRV